MRFEPPFGILDIWGEMIAQGWLLASELIGSLPPWLGIVVVSALVLWRWSRPPSSARVLIPRSGTYQATRYPRLRPRLRRKRFLN
jgi:hypothetical protein